MPIDTSIYNTPPPQPFNSPFQTLGALGALQRQQQEIQSAKTLEAERQQKIIEQQKAQQSADTFHAIIGNPNLTPEAVRAQIQAKAPEHLAAFDESVAKIQEAADKHNESLAHYHEAMAKAQETTQNVISATANEIAAHGYNPLAFEVGLRTVEARIPDFKAQADLMRQEALKNGPDWIKEQVQGWQKQSDLKTAAEIPEVAAKAALAQKINAGTSPTGVTSEQQAAEADRQAQLRVAQGNLAVNQGRLTVEQQKAKDEAAAKTAKAAQGRPVQAADINKISDLDKSISELKDLGNKLSTGQGMGGMARIENAIVPGGLAPYVPGAEAAKETAANIALARQVAGRAIHGGVMRKNDQEQAEQYMPKQDDPPQVVQAKLANILKLANDSKIGHIENLKRGGFDVSGFQSAIGASAPLRKEIPGHPGSFAVSKDDGKTWQAE
jgi:hypothetical protein